VFALSKAYIKRMNKYASVVNENINNLKDNNRRRLRDALSFFHEAYVTSYQYFFGLAIFSRI
jgi:hypothetical protein